MKYEIKHRFSGVVLFSIETKSSKLCVEAAVTSGADLRGANLYGANLRGANLYSANLYGANLIGANLYGANLIGANLYGADLRGANLYGANLRGANLYSANLYGANLIGEDGAKLTVTDRPLVIGPIGSRADYLTAWATDQGIWIRTGCFWNTLDAFVSAVAKKHGDSLHGHHYQLAIDLIRARLAPAESTEQAAREGT